MAWQNPPDQADYVLTDPLNVGARYRVPVAALLAALHLDTNPTGAPTPPARHGATDDLTRTECRAWMSIVETVA